MTVRVVIEAVLLSIMVAGALFSVIGMMRSKDALVSVHCASLASVVVPTALLAAVAVAKLGSEASVKTLVICLICLVSSPIASHALARAIFLRSER